MPRNYKVTIDPFRQQVGYVRELNAAKLERFQQKTRRGKKFLENRAPKIFENSKHSFIVKGGKTNQAISDVLHEIYSLKKPFVELLKRNNPFHPFDNDTGLIKFSQKFDASLFCFGENTKKRPDTLIFGRMFDYQVLDMVEFHITNFVHSKEFKEGKVVLGAKPVILLQGTHFESDEILQRVGNLMIDWFRGTSITSVRLQGLELIISLTAKSETEIGFRVYKTQLKKSGIKTPRVELIEIGPRIDLQLRRHKLASKDLFRSALRKPKELKAKPRKNTAKDVFGTKMLKIHVGKQKADDIQTRKVKALKIQRSSENGVRDDEEEMEVGN